MFVHCQRGRSLPGWRHRGDGSRWEYGLKREIQLCQWRCSVWWLVSIQGSEGWMPTYEAPCKTRLSEKAVVRVKVEWSMKQWRHTTDPVKRHTNVLYMPLHQSSTTTHNMNHLSMLRFYCLRVWVWAESPWHSSTYPRTSGL